MQHCTELHPEEHLVEVGVAKPICLLVGGHEDAAVRREPFNRIPVAPSDLELAAVQRLVDVGFRCPQVALER